MKSFIAFLLLTILAIHTAAQDGCKICGDKLITNPEGVLFELGNNGGCEFVAGNDPSIPLAICPALGEIGFGIGQVTCEEFETFVSDISDFICGLLPEQVDSVCACSDTLPPAPEPEPATTIREFLINFFRALFGF